jgi:hypothetical protein
VVEVVASCFHFRMSRIQISVPGTNFLTEVRVVLLHVSTQLPEKYHILGHDRFHLRSFQAIIISRYSTLYSLSQ